MMPSAALARRCWGGTPEFVSHSCQTASGREGTLGVESAVAGTLGEWVTIAYSVAGSMTRITATALPTCGMRLLHATGAPAAIYAMQVPANRMPPAHCTAKRV